MESKFNCIKTASKNQVVHGFERHDCFKIVAEEEINLIEDNITKLRSDLFDLHQYREKLVGDYQDWKSRGSVKDFAISINKLLQEVCLQLELWEADLDNYYECLSELEAYEKL